MQFTCWQLHFVETLMGAIYPFRPLTDPPFNPLPDRDVRSLPLALILEFALSCSFPFHYVAALGR